MAIADERVFATNQDLTRQSSYLAQGYSMNAYLPSHIEQSQNLPAQPYFSSMFPVTAEQYQVSTDPLPYGGPQINLSARSSAGFAMDPGPRLHQPQQQSGMSSSSPYECLVPATQSLYGWFPADDLGPPLASVTPSLSQPLPPAFPHSHFIASPGVAWMQHVSGWSTDSGFQSSPDGDTGLSASSFPGAFAEYDSRFPIDAAACTDLQSSIALTHDAVPPIQSAASQSSEPVCGPGRQARECRWLTRTNGVLRICGGLVMPDRRSVGEHLQQFHDLKPGEEKARQRCLWEQCTTSLNKESLARHVVTVHLKEGVQCTDCGLLFARDDSLKRHLKGGQHKMPAEKSVSGAKQPPANRSGSV